MKNQVYIVIGAILLIIVAFFIGYYAKPVDNSKLNDISGQLNQTQKTNANLNAYVVSLESQISDVKNTTKSVTSGNVPFWNQDNTKVLNIRVPMDTISAKKASLDIIRMYTEGYNEKYYKLTIKKNGKTWSTNFSCDQNQTDITVCSGMITIDEANRSFDLMPSE